MKKIWYPPYKDFKCLGPDCPMNCCEYYAIRLFKKEEAEFDSKPQWQDIDGQGGRMRDFVEPDGDGVRCKSRPDGGCIFWADNRKCSIQCRYGTGAMPVVCRSYPRIIGRYADRIEFGMEPCCPIVAASVKDWNIGELGCEGGAPEEGRSALMEKRDRAVAILADRSLDFRSCLVQIAELYDSPAAIPEITVSGEKLEFLRRVTALMCWSYLVYFDGVREVDNLVTVIINAISLFISGSAGRDFGSWERTGLEFSRILVDYYIRIGYDIDHEDRYCDLAEYNLL